jgi:hypothetical protein
MGQRLTGMTADQKKFRWQEPFSKFDRYGQAGAYISELLPYTAKIADDICIVKNDFYRSINHDPALTFFQTGAQVGNRPSMGSWVSYGLAQRIKSSIVLCIAFKRERVIGQGCLFKLWTNGFLDSTYQGVQFSSGEHPVLYLNDADGITREDRRKMLDKLGELNEESYKEFGDPEIAAKIQQYELAYRMQTAVPEITDLSKEPESIVKMYGPECLVAGHLCSQLFACKKAFRKWCSLCSAIHQGWDGHNNLPRKLLVSVKMLTRQVLH